MPIISKYSNEEINNLTEELLDLVQNKNISVDLALIALGNTVTNIIDANVKPEQKVALATSFADALKASLKQ
jgi:hypothetical protein